MDGSEQTDQRECGQHRGEIARQNRTIAIQQRLIGTSERFGTDHSRVQEHDDQRGQSQRENAQAGRLRNVLFRLTHFLCSQRQLLNTKEQPHGERHGVEDGTWAERQERGVAFGRRDIEQRGEIGLTSGESADTEQCDDGERGDRHDFGETERRFGAQPIDHYENRIQGKPPNPSQAMIVKRISGQVRQDRISVCRREVDDGGCGHHILDGFRKAGEEAAPRTHGGTREGIRATRVWHGRRHFADGVEHKHVHEVHHDGGHQHATPSGLGDASVPAGEVAGDHRGNADGP